MSDTLVNLRRKIASADDLHAVVRTMKAMAVSQVSQYEKAVLSLEDYYRTVQLALIAYFRQLNRPESIESNRASPLSSSNAIRGHKPRIGAVLFGSDQGLVGQFNETLASFVTHELGENTSDQLIWVVGERLHALLSQKTWLQCHQVALPKALPAIETFVSEVLLDIESHRARGEISDIILFHNRPMNRETYQPVKERLFPFDQTWLNQLHTQPWPSNCLPDVIDFNAETLLTFIHEYLFVALYRACAESLSSESSSRLITMMRAEKNIDELLDSMTVQFYGLRQNSIDEELFDVISGFNALRSESGD